MAKVAIRVNGKRHVVEAARDTPLLYVLRNELHLRGPRFGCGLAQCGACTVQVDGEADPLLRHAGERGRAASRSRRSKGSAAQRSPAPCRRRSSSNQAAQCGYCTNGMIIAADAFLNDHPDPTEDEIKRAMTPYLCRCGTHFRIVAAIKDAAKAQR